jgi:molecular chaperone GrpE
MCVEEQVKKQEAQAAPEDVPLQATRDELAECQLQVQEWKDKFVQMNADLQNFRKRMEKEQMGWSQAAQAKIFTELLTVVDNFDRAIAEKPQTDQKEIVAWIDGISMIHGFLTKLLEQFNVRPMDSYSEFNPRFHEALMQVDSPDHKSGQIVAVLEKGYMMGDIVLRPAKVSVAK